MARNRHTANSARCTVPCSTGAGLPRSVSVPTIALSARRIISWAGSPKRQGYPWKDRYRSDGRDPQSDACQRRAQRKLETALHATHEILTDNDVRAQGSADTMEVWRGKSPQ
jgi:hypothetical protein